MEKIKFEYQGEQYELTQREINAAYFYRMNKDRLEEAKRRLETTVFGGEIHTLNEQAVDDVKAIFRIRYGIDYTQIEKRLADIVEYYEMLYDAGTDDNALWSLAIDKAMKTATENVANIYERMRRFYIGHDAALTQIALDVFMQVGAARLEDHCVRDLPISGAFTEDVKQEVRKMVMLMKHAAPNVLLAFIQRVMHPFEDATGKDIPLLHPNGDEESVCPACGSVICSDGESRFGEDDELDIEEDWYCSECGATGTSVFLPQFHRHKNVSDKQGQPIKCRREEGEADNY